MSISNEDLLTAEELASQWPKLLATAASMARLARPDDHKAHTALEKICVASPSDFSQILTIYPPRSSDPWWLQKSDGEEEEEEKKKKKKEKMGWLNQFAAWLLRMDDLNESVGVAHQASAIRPAQWVNGQWIPNVFSPVSPIALDGSRLVHRLLRYCIYYTRHSHPAMFPASLQDYVDVSSDDHG